MIVQSKLDELKVAWQLVDASKFHNLKTRLRFDKEHEVDPID